MGSGLWQRRRVQRNRTFVKILETLDAVIGKYDVHALYKYMHLFFRFSEELRAYCRKYLAH